MHHNLKHFITASALSLSFALVFALVGVAGAQATEITGTLGTSPSSNTGSTATSGGTNNTSGTVVGGTPDSSGGTSNASSGSTANSSSGSSSGGSVATRSDHPHTMVASNPPYMQSDGSLAATPEYTGTGGGYSPSLDAYLSSLGNKTNNISAADAVAYNKNIAPASVLENVAAAGAASPLSEGKVMTLIIIGLAVAGLAWYAVNAYLAYRNERGI